jgi:polysaccharide biosynthesis transport protein
MNNHHRTDSLDQIRELWGTIVLHRWAILLATVVLGAVSTVVISLLPDTYVASTTVLFDPQKLPERYVAPTVTADPAQKLNTLTQEILSPGRLQQISQQLHLLSQSSPEDVVNQMRKAITIDMKQNSDHDMSAFVITYSGQDPQITAEVADRLAQSFIDWDLANRAQQAANTTDFMAAQLRDAKQSLDTEQQKLDEYKQQYSGELPEQLQSNMQSLAMLRSAQQANSEELNRLEQEKNSLTTNPEAARTNGPSVPTERDRLEGERRTLQAELASLRSQYTEWYPDVVTTRQRLESVTKQLSKTDGGASTGVPSVAARLQVIQRETDRLQDEQQKLAHRIEKYQVKVDATPLRGQEFEYLNRNYTNARDRYEGLLDQKFHAEMAMDLERQQKGSRFTVDPAQVPRQPSKPNRPLLLAMALPFCAFIPMGIAVGAAEIRGTVNSERMLRTLLPDAARVVGSIPMIETPFNARKRRRLAMLSLLSSLLCCVMVAMFLWGGTAAHMRKNHAHQFVTPTPNAKLGSQ